jgi:hypothetical protein
MKYCRKLLLALLAGAVTGALVLGITGRAATAGVAIITGNTLNLSLWGWFEAVIVGTLVGAFGGVLLLMLRSVQVDSELARGITAGAILFLCFSLVTWFKGKVAFGLSSIQLFTLGVVAIIFIVYGVCTDALLTRFESRGRTDSIACLM